MEPPSEKDKRASVAAFFAGANRIRLAKSLLRSPSRPDGRPKPKHHRPFVFEAGVKRPSPRSSPPYGSCKCSLGHTACFVSVLRRTGGIDVDVDGPAFATSSDLKRQRVGSLLTRAVEGVLGITEDLRISVKCINDDGNIVAVAFHGVVKALGGAGIEVPGHACVLSVSGCEKTFFVDPNIEEENVLLWGIIAGFVENKLVFVEKTGVGLPYETMFTILKDMKSVAKTVGVQLKSALETDSSTIGEKADNRSAETCNDGAQGAAGGMLTFEVSDSDVSSSSGDGADDDDEDQTTCDKC